MSFSSIWILVNQYIIKVFLKLCIATDQFVFIYANIAHSTGEDVEGERMLFAASRLSVPISI